MRIFALKQYNFYKHMKKVVCIYFLFVYILKLRPEGNVRLEVMRENEKEIGIFREKIEVLARKGCHFKIHFTFSLIMA